MYFKSETKYIEIGRPTDTNIDMLLEERDWSDILDLNPAMNPNKHSDILLLRKSIVGAESLIVCLANTS